jgi:WD40 repeat protein
MKRYYYLLLIRNKFIDSYTNLNIFTCITFVTNTTFSPDVKTTATGSDDITIKLWNLNLDDLMAQGCAWLHDYLVNNPNASDEDRQMCGIAPRQK